MRMADSDAVPPENQAEIIIDAKDPVEPRDCVNQLRQSGESIIQGESTDPSPRNGEPELQTSVDSAKQPIDPLTSQSYELNQKPTVNKSSPSKENVERVKEDEKLAMYKALAIKLKKELVKSREELTKLKEISHIESNNLRNKLDLIERTLDTERQTHETLIATLEDRVKTLQHQLRTSESELQSIQNEFESYKLMASKIMQQSASSKLNPDRTFEEDRYKKLKELNDDQRKRISHLEAQLETSSKKNNETHKKSLQLQDDLDKLKDRLKIMDTEAGRCEILTQENNNLRLALCQFRSKLKEPHCLESDKASKLAEEADKPSICDYSCNTLNNANQNESSESSINLPTLAENLAVGLSPSTSLKGESQTNSSSSRDGSTSGYVHIKPATFEIISRSCVLDDAQNQIDNLTKAYLDSESTNSLLTEQVRALKEEIRRLQRGSERLVLAENLEYLKNVVFKFLSLDSSQVEQKQRLIPVLSTVLKLSPDETTKLNSLTIADRPSMASSFFKL